MSREENAESAVIDKDDHRNWVALVRTYDRLEVFRISDEDAWDFDIEKRLLVRIVPDREADPPVCRIISKRRALV